MFADVIELKYDAELAEERARLRASLKAEHEAEQEARLWEEKRQIARDLRGDGVSIESIAKATKLPIYEIEKL